MSYSSGSSADLHQRPGEWEVKKDKSKVDKDLSTLQDGLKEINNLNKKINKLETKNNNLKKEIEHLKWYTIGIGALFGSIAGIYAFIKNWLKKGYKIKIY